MGAAVPVVVMVPVVVTGARGCNSAHGCDRCVVVTGARGCELDTKGKDIFLLEPCSRKVPSAGWEPCTVRTVPPPLANGRDP